MTNVIDFGKKKNEKDKEKVYHKTYIETTGEAKYYDVEILLDTLMDHFVICTNIHEDEDGTIPDKEVSKELMTEINLIKTIQSFKMLKILFSKLDLTTYLGAKIWSGIPHGVDNDDYMIYIDQMNIKKDIGLTISIKVKNAQVVIKDNSEEEIDSYFGYIWSELTRVYSERETYNFLNNLKYIMSMYDVEIITGSKGERYIIFNLNHFLVCSVLIEVDDDGAV